MGCTPWNKYNTYSNKFTPSRKGKVWPGLFHSPEIKQWLLTERKAEETLLPGSHKVWDKNTSLKRFRSRVHEERCKLLLPYSSFYSIRRPCLTGFFNAYLRFLSWLSRHPLNRMSGWPVGDCLSLNLQPVKINTKQRIS